MCLTIKKSYIILKYLIIGRGKKILIKELHEYKIFCVIEIEIDTYNHFVDVVDVEFKNLLQIEIIHDYDF